MPNSLLQRLFGRKKRATDAGSLSVREPVKTLVQAGTPSRDAADQEDRKPLESRPALQNAGAMTNVSSLFAFVDPKDPFTAGGKPGEEPPETLFSLLGGRDSRPLFS